jgi:carboxypeptidase C (cathepsin A)
LLKNYFSASDYTPFLASAHPKLRLIPPCTYAKPTLAYLNNATVRTQLNIPQSVQAWDLCNEEINTNYQKYPGGSIEVYRNLKDKYKILKYSGDTDMAVSTYGTKGWIENENWTITQDWKQYFVGSQVGGYVETRNNGKFTFATIHGAGHMAPQWRPEFTYHTVFNWIKNQAI